MSVAYITNSIRCRLWGKSAGRCQYDGCNTPLWIDSQTKVDLNKAYIAHIVADKPDGPRGCIKLSEELKNKLSNLMLLCDEHHRLIDKIDVEGHSVERLQKMKGKHEQRIELLTSISEKKKSHVLLYGANIGEHSAYVSWGKAAHAMTPKKYPAESHALELGLSNSDFQDDETEFWCFEKENLNRQFRKTVLPRLRDGSIDHLSVFALAPQPLLIELGRLLSDIPAADIYQLHREPPDWKWQNKPDGFSYDILEPENKGNIIALNLSLSASIDNLRIAKVLGDKASIWTMSINSPNNDFMKSYEQLSLFRSTFRMLLNRIKVAHGQDVEMHLFPAVPISVAVEIGRTWMPKADLPLIIYDHSNRHNGFEVALRIVGGSTGI